MRTFDEEWAQVKEYYQSGEHQEEIKKSKQILLEKPFVLYGAGIEGVEFANVLAYGQCLPVCFCDKNKSGTEPSTGLNIISPKELLDKYQDTNIVISSSLYCKEIEHDLSALGVPQSRILPRRLLLLLLLQLCSEGTAAYGKYLKRSHYLMLFNALSEMVTDETGAQLAGCRQTYDWLSDERSKKVFMDYLKLCFIAAPVEPSPLNTQYFDPVMELNDREVFVDCGAYTGDTAENFMDRVNNQYEHYFAFEPDLDNYKKAAAFLKDKPAATLIPKGLWNCDTTLCFKEGCASCSTVTETGEVAVDVTSIDHYFSNKKQIPTIIKMDIEGSELEALKGAEQTIHRHKPKLAICIYHKPEDLYEIPQFIKSCRSDYRFYIRHYTDTFAELVLYAI